jgi:hypothetical protein
LDRVLGVPDAADDRAGPVGSSTLTIRPSAERAMRIEMKITPMMSVRKMAVATTGMMLRRCFDTASDCTSSPLPRYSVGEG